MLEQMPKVRFAFADLDVNSRINAPLKNPTWAPYRPKAAPRVDRSIIQPQRLGVEAAVSDSNKFTTPVRQAATPLCPAAPLRPKGIRFFDRTPIQSVRPGFDYDNTTEERRMDSILESPSEEEAEKTSFSHNLMDVIRALSHATVSNKQKKKTDLGGSLHSKEVHLSKNSPICGRHAIVPLPTILEVPDVPDFDEFSTPAHS